MSTSSHQTKNTSASNLRSILDEASVQYKELTGYNLATHPFAAKFDNWDSADTILEVFQDQARKFNEFRKGNEKLMEWLKPTVQIMVSISASLGNAATSVQLVFTGISILIGVSLFLNSLSPVHVTSTQAAAGVVASYEVLVNLFESVRYFLQRLKIYAGIPLTTELTQIFGRIMAEIILILALGTKELMRGSISE